MSCEDQGYGLISDGCLICQTFDASGKVIRPALVKVDEYGVVWWRCPTCNGSYGPVAKLVVSA